MLCYFLNYSFILFFLLILFYFCFLNSVEADKGGMRKKERDPRGLPQDNFIITTSGFFFFIILSSLLKANAHLGGKKFVPC